MPPQISAILYALHVMNLLPQVGKQEIKNLDLMKYLIRLVTPKGGTVYDPFAGSGTTLIAAKDLEVNSIGVELSEEYCKIIQDRINAVTSPLEQIL